MFSSDPDSLKGFGENTFRDDLCVAFCYGHNIEKCQAERLNHEINGSF